MYASFLWNDICRKEQVIAKLRKFQRLALSAITSAWNSTPTAALEALLNIPLLHILIESKANLTLDRLARQQNNTHRRTDHTEIWLEATDKEPSLPMPTDRIISTFLFDKKFDISIPPRERWLNGILPPEHSIVLYTDGSVIKNSAGLGFYCEEPKLEKAISLGVHSSIFLAEIKAILESCYFIQNKSISDELIFICSDSQAALKALSAAMLAAIHLIILLQGTE